SGGGAGRRGGGCRDLRVPPGGKGRDTRRTKAGVESFRQFDHGFQMLAITVPICKDATGQKVPRQNEPSHSIFAPAGVTRNPGGRRPKICQPLTSFAEVMPSAAPPTTSLTQCSRW